MYESHVVGTGRVCVCVCICRVEVCRMRLVGNVCPKKKRINKRFIQRPFNKSGFVGAAKASWGY